MATRIHSLVHENLQTQHPTKPNQGDHRDLETGGSPKINYDALLAAVVHSAIEGLVYVTSLMIGLGTVSQTTKVMVVSCFTGLVAGTFSVAMLEFISPSAQYDFQMAHGKGKEKENLLSPIQEAGASALAFGLGGLLPLLTGGFVRPWTARVGVVCGVTSLGLGGFGAAGGHLGGASKKKSALRVLIGGWFAMLFTYGVFVLFGFVFKVEMSSA